MQSTRRSVTPLRPDQLTPEHWSLWSEWQQNDPTLKSPYFRPEFTRAVASVRNDVEVAVLEQEGEPVGFFPFQRGRFQVGKPVGGPLSDFQGVISRPGIVWDAEELIRGCGLRTWDFDHLLASQQTFRPWQRVAASSPYLDLTAGFKAFQAKKRAEGSATMRQTAKLARKIEREVGPLHYQPSTSDRHVFETLIRWKADQYHRTNFTNVFGFPWTVALLERILAEQAPAFAGRLSALYAGDHLVAVHMGMVSHDVLHRWFPAYDPLFGRYSPGTLEFLEQARAAEEGGIKRIDLGKGEGQFKTSLMSGTIPMAEGSVECRSAARFLRHNWRSTKEWVKSSRLGGPARIPARWLLYFREWIAFR